MGQRNDLFAAQYQCYRPLNRTRMGMSMGMSTPPTGARAEDQVQGPRHLMKEMGRADLAANAHAAVVSARPQCLLHWLPTLDSGVL